MGRVIAQSYMVSTDWVTETNTDPSENRAFNFQDILDLDASGNNWNVSELLKIAVILKDGIRFSTVN